MSIEIDLGRIANSLEQIVNHLDLAAKGQDVAAPVKETKTKTTKAVAREVVAPVVEDNDPFGANAAAVEEKEISFDELSTLLKDHSVKLGVKTTIALIKKHGADQATPKLNTIPKANYKACYLEATNDLVKIKKV